MEDKEDYNDVDVSLLYQKVIENDSLDINQQKALLNEIRKLKPVTENRWIFRSVILVLALIALAYPAILVVNSYTGALNSDHDGILTLSSAAVGALVAYANSLIKK